MSTKFVDQMNWTGNGRKKEKRNELKYGSLMLFR